MKIDRKLDDSYRVLIPIEIRNKLDIKKYEPVILDFNEETKEITIVFNKYKKDKTIVKAPISPIEKLPNPLIIEPLESVSTKLHIRKRNLVTIPNSIFKELKLSKQRYNVMCITELNQTTLTFNLNKDGIYNYRKENILSFSEINTYFNLDIHEGIFCNFKYKSDGTLIFTFNSIDIRKKESKYRVEEISPEERLTELNHKAESDGLCQEEYNELNKIAKQLEPSIKVEKVIEDINLIEPESEKDLLEELGPDIQHELKEYRKQLPKFKKTDTIELKNIGDSIIVKPCPRCGNTIIGDKTLKINGQIHCEECSKDFKNQLIEELKRKHKR
jgi:bifunctional DNA-binding transcriptional regulator/antitoxin component of YhaV-PrlF toxin-antitoxin module